MKPIVVLSNAHEQCLTFFWPNGPQFYVGYRPIEGAPQTLAAPLAGIGEQPSGAVGDRLDQASVAPAAPPTDLSNANWATHYHEANSADPIQFEFQANADGTARCSGHDNGGAQTREL